MTDELFSGGLLRATRGEHIYKPAEGIIDPAIGSFTNGRFRCLREQCCLARSMLYFELLGSDRNVIGDGMHSLESSYIFKRLSIRLATTDGPVTIMDGCLSEKIHEVRQVGMYFCRYMEHAQRVRTPFR